VEDPAAYAELRSYFFDAQDEIPKEGMRQTRGKKAPPRISRCCKKIQLQLQQLDEGPLKEHREALILLRQLRYFESVGACRKEYPPWCSVVTDPDFHEVVDLCDSDEEMPPVVDAEEFLLGLVNEKGFVTTQVVKADPDALAEKAPIVAVKLEAEGNPEHVGAWRNPWSSDDDDGKKSNRRERGDEGRRQAQEKGLSKKDDRPKAAATAARRKRARGTGNPARNQGGAARRPRWQRAGNRCDPLRMQLSLS